MKSSIPTKKYSASHRTVLRVDDDVEFVLDSKSESECVNGNRSLIIATENEIEQSRRTYSKINPLAFVQRVLPKENFDGQKCVSPIKKPRIIYTMGNIKTRNTIQNGTQKSDATVQKVDKVHKNKIQSKKKRQMCNSLLSSMNSSKNLIKKPVKIKHVDELQKSKTKLLDQTLKNVIKKEIDTDDRSTDFLSRYCQPSTSSSPQYNFSYSPNNELKRNNISFNNFSGKKFDLRKVKEESSVDNPVKPFYKLDTKALIINEADTAPVMHSDSDIHSDKAFEISQNPLKLSPSMKWVSPKVAPKPVSNGGDSPKGGNTPRKEVKDNNVAESYLNSPSIKKQRGRKRELDSLYENLKEISWVQNGSFNFLLCDKSLRHAERVNAKTGKPRQQMTPEEVKTTKNVSMSHAAVGKKRNMPMLIKKKRATTAETVTQNKIPLSTKSNKKVNPGKILKKPHSKATKIIPDKLFEKNISEKSPKKHDSGNMLENCNGTTQRSKRNRPSSKPFNEATEVIVLSDDSETSPPPDVKPKVVDVVTVGATESETAPEIVHCNTSADVKKRKRIPKKNKKLNLFNGVNIFQNFLGSGNRGLPSLQRSSNFLGSGGKRLSSLPQRTPELRVTLEPLETTDLWSSDNYLQNAVHNEYENFRKTVIQQAMLKVFQGVNDGPISSMFRELQENFTASVDISTSKKRKSKEESVRTSVRQSECAFRYKEIVVKKHDNFIQVVLVPNSQKQNSLTIEAMKELKEAFLAAKKDPNCSAVLINSSGSFFCSGLDLGQLMGANKKQVAEEMALTLRDLILTLGLFTKPVVAAVNGAAIGFGVALLTFCDIVLASDKATFCIPAAKLGYVPEGAVTLTLPQVVGAGVAVEMLLEGRRLTAQQALRHGLVSEVLWPTQLMEQVIPRVQMLVAQPQQVMEATKTMVRCHLWEKLALHAEQEWRLLPPQWLEPGCQHNIKKLLQTGWTAE